MKLSNTLLIFLLVFSLSGFSEVRIFTFKGQVHFNNKSLKGAKVDVYQAGELIYETTTNGGGKFEFDLEAEQDYMVEISKEDLRTKIIWIKTRHTQNLKFKIPVFAFDVYLKKEKRTPYDELSEIPVTLIKYQPKKKVFYMDKTYQATIKNMKRRIKEKKFQVR